MKCNSNSAPEYATDTIQNQQIEHQKKTYTFLEFSISLSLLSMSKNVLIKAQKPQLHCCPDGLLVKFRVYQAMPMHAPIQVPLVTILLFFFLIFSLQSDARKVCLHIFEMYRLLLRLKPGQNNIEVSFRHFCSVYIAAISGFYFSNQPML